METKISQLLDALGLKQTDFAKEVGSSSAVINQIVSGNRNMGITLMSRVKARWPNIDCNWFFLEGIPIFLDEKKTAFAIQPDSKKCTHCIELEAVIKDQREIIATLRKAIESNNILFEAMREQVKRK